MDVGVAGSWDLPEALPHDSMGPSRLRGCRVGFARLRQLRSAQVSRAARNGFDLDLQADRCKRSAPFLCPGYDAAGFVLTGVRAIPDSNRSETVDRNDSAR